MSQDISGAHHWLSVMRRAPCSIGSLLPTPTPWLQDLVGADLSRTVRDGVTAVGPGSRTWRAAGIDSWEARAPRVMVPGHCSAPAVGTGQLPGAGSALTLAPLGSILTGFAAAGAVLCSPLWVPRALWLFDSSGSASSWTMGMDDSPNVTDDAADEIMDRIVKSATQVPSQRVVPRERKRSRANRKSRKCLGVGVRDSGSWERAPGALWPGRAGTQRWGFVNCPWCPAGPPVVFDERVLCWSVSTGRWGRRCAAAACPPWLPCLVRPPLVHTLSPGRSERPFDDFGVQGWIQWASCQGLPWVLCWGHVSAPHPALGGHFLGWRLFPSGSLLPTNVLKMSPEVASDFMVTAAAAASLQSCPTLCDPIGGSPPGKSTGKSHEQRSLVGCRL